MSAFVSTSMVVAALIGCGSKAPPVSSGDAAAAASAATDAVSASFPTDAASQAFVAALTGLTITDFHAVDAGGARVILRTLNFRGDATWVAEGYVDAGEEQMECTENGTWSMDAAESADKATLDWVIAATDCIGREVGDRTRALITIDGGDVDIAFR